LPARVAALENQVRSLELQVEALSAAPQEIVRQIQELFRKKADPGRVAFWSLLSSGLQLRDLLEPPEPPP
jgi:hypothetical protein